MSRLHQSIAGDIARGTYDGAATIVTVGGRVVFEEAVGFADRIANRPLRIDAIFPIFSIAKPLIAVSVLQQVERGLLRLDMPVCEIIGAFASKGKQQVTIGQLLCHRAGMPARGPDVPPERLGDLDAVFASICDVGLDAVPGEAVSYSPTMAYAVLAACVRSVDGGERRFRTILRDDVFAPLGMDDTALGMPHALASRAVTPRVSDPSPGLFDPAGLMQRAALCLDPDRDIEIPGGGIVSTVSDINRFSQALRQGGHLDGKRILAPATLDLATRNHTGTLPNDLWTFARETKGWPLSPANLGLGFFLRGEGPAPAYCGQLASPRTYGAMGAGTTNVWVDPERDMTMVCLTTGFMEETNSAHRFQRLSDLAIEAFG